MNRKKYNRSFARRLTQWVMLVLFIMMSALGYLIYKLAKSIVVEMSADAYHADMQASASTITGVLANVSTAVRNNTSDVERHLHQPEQLQGIMERIIVQNPRIRSCGVSFIENYYPQRGRSFCPYAWNEDSVQNDKRSIEGYDDTYLRSKWFVEAVAADSAYWSQPFFDGHDAKTPLVAYLQPIHDEQGRVVAILGADLSLDFMTGLVQSLDSIFRSNAWYISLTDEATSYVLAHDGTYITHPDHRRILKGNFFVHIKDADTRGLAKEAIQQMMEGQKSYSETDKVMRVNRVENYLFYLPLMGIDWTLAVAVPKLSLDIIGILVGFLMLLIIGMVLVVTFFVCRLAIRRAANPLKQLATTADKVASGQFNAALPTINSRDEIHQLRDSFENMQTSLSAYMEELKSTTAAKASMESELKIAHGIQMSMLPKTYPAFPDRHDIDIYGMVEPAKAVGGDLYDFFIRDEKLIFCIGDVSGKGVPASLVMAVTCSLFRNIAAYTQEPDHIALALNEALCGNNDTGMFVTIFLGVLDLTSGCLSYTNAGHNPPLMVTGNEASKLTCDSNIPAGVMPGWQFTVQHHQMNKGDSVFLYTDGLNEAEDSNHRQFGLERMLQVARLTINKPQPLIEAMTSSVHLYMGDTEQGDDLTMLAIQYTHSLSSN